MSSTQVLLGPRVSPNQLLMRALLEQELQMAGTKQRLPLYPLLPLPGRTARTYVYHRLLSQRVLLPDHQD